MASSLCQSGHIILCVLRNCQPLTVLIQTCSFVTNISQNFPIDIKIRGLGLSIVGMRALAGQQILTGTRQGFVGKLWRCLETWGTNLTLLWGQP